MIGSSSGSLRGKNSRLTSQGRVNQKCSAHLSFTYKQEMRKTTAAGAAADLDIYIYIYPTDELSSASVRVLSRNCYNACRSNH